MLLLLAGMSCRVMSAVADVNERAQAPLKVFVFNVRERGHGAIELHRAVMHTELELPRLVAEYQSIYCLHAKGGCSPEKQPEQDNGAAQ